MEFLLAFLLGIMAFVTPCILPMMPIYVAYFAGGGERSAGKTLRNALGFVLGFSIVYMALGAFVGLIGQLLIQYRTVTDLVLGAIVILFGLNYMGVLKLPFFGGISAGKRGTDLTFFSSVLFGIVFSIPGISCASGTLFSALSLTPHDSGVLMSVLKLLAYSLGMGIPILLSALLIDQLKRTFAFIKRNFKTINMISGALMILMGILMMTGLMGRYMSLFSA